MSSLDNLKKAARRWLKAIRAGDPDARRRLERVMPAAAANPVLRDVQHALAREHGHENWLDLTRAVNREIGSRTSPDLEQIERFANNFLRAYRTGEPQALAYLAAHLQRDVTWEALRTEVRQRLAVQSSAERPAGDLTLDDVHQFIAKSAGCDTWNELAGALTVDGSTSGAATPSHATIPQEREHRESGMLHPVELRLTLPMELPGGVYSTTTDVWHMLVACKTGDLEQVRALVTATPDLARCEYNYMPPLHLAVREGHLGVVQFLLAQEAYDPAYTPYPYKGETLVTMADDRGHAAIATALRERAGQPGAALSRNKGVHGVGHIEFPRDDDRSRLEKLIGANAVHAVEALLDRRPDLAQDELAFYAEGVLAQAANRSTRPLLDLLLARGARVPEITKWGRFYYFKHAEIAELLLERGMNPDHMTWHRTTLLHDMAGEGNTEKARLLLTHGAQINPVDDEFRSTPLGFAARWGRRDLVRLLLDHGADPNVAGADWATPLAWAEKKGHRAIAGDLRAAGAR
jgi:hypothetical protein